MSSNDYLTLFKRDLFSKDFLNASINVEGISLDNGKIRFKGSTTPFFPKRPYKIKFSKKIMFPNSNGVKHINLNPCFTDKSYIREKLLWDLFHQWGGTGPHSYCYADLTINNSYRGIFVCIDALNKEFLESEGLSGNLYEAEEESKIKADLSLILDDDLIKRAYEKEAGDINDYSDLKNLISKINSTPESEFASVMHETFEMKSVYDWLVLNTIAQTGDTYVKNYYLYHDISKSSQSWRIFPWDYDMSMGRDAADGIPYPADHLNDFFSYTYTPLDGPNNVLKDRIKANSSLYSEYKVHLKNILLNFFTEENLFPKIDQYVADISESVQNDPQRWNSYSDFLDQVEAIKCFISGRRNYLLNSFLGMSNAENDEATVSVSQANYPYYFIDGQGKVMATIWFQEIGSLQSISVKVHPLKDISTSSQYYVKRKFQIIPYPSSASFKATIQWEYVHEEGRYDEVVNVEDERMLRAFTSNGTQINSYTNSYADKVTMYDVTQDDCGIGSYFYLMVPQLPETSWKRTENIFWHRWHDISFVNTQNGFICGDDGEFLMTGDGGSTWTQSYVGIHLAMNKMFAINPNDVFVVGESSCIFKTINGGRTWFNSNPNIPGKNLNDISGSSPNLFAVGNDGLFLFSSNNGQTWITKSVSGAGDLFAVVSLDKDEVVAAGSSGKIFKSDNSGNSWKNISNANSRTLKALYLKNENNIYGVGKGGTLIVSNDKGESWAVINTGIEIDLLCITSYNETFYLGGLNGKVYKSSDLNNWTEESLPGGFDVYRMIFTPDGKGFAVGSSGSICITK